MNIRAICISALLLALPSSGTAGDLSEPYNVSIGEMIELHCGVWDGLTSFASEGFLGSTYVATVYYSKATDMLQIVYLGEKDSIDNAKYVLDLINQQVMPKIIQYAKTKFNLALDSSAFLLIYRNKVNDKDILMMEKGIYVFPK